MFLDEWLRKLLSGGGAQGSPMPSYRDFVTPDIHHTRPADMPPMLSYTPGRVTKGSGLKPRRLKSKNECPN